MDVAQVALLLQPIGFNLHAYWAVGIVGCQLSGAEGGSSRQKVGQVCCEMYTPRATVIIRADGGWLHHRDGQSE